MLIPDRSDAISMLGSCPETPVGIQRPSPTCWNSSSGSRCPACGTGSPRAGRCGWAVGAPGDCSAPEPSETAASLLPSSLLAAASVGVWAGLGPVAVLAVLPVPTVRASLEDHLGDGGSLHEPESSGHTESFHFLLPCL